MRNYDDFKPIDLDMSHNYVKAINIVAEDLNSELKNSSTLISGAAQRDKIIFFENQRNILGRNFIVK